MTEPHCGEKNLLLIPDCITWKVGSLFNPTPRFTIANLDDALYAPNDNLVEHILSLCNNEIIFTDVCCIKSTDRVNLVIPLTFSYGNKLYAIHRGMPVGKYGMPHVIDDIDVRMIVVNMIDGVSGPEFDDDVLLYLYGNYLNISLANNRYTIETVVDGNNTICTLTVLFEKFNVLLEEIGTINNNKCTCPGDILVPQNDLCSKAYWHIIESHVDLNIAR